MRNDPRRLSQHLLPRNAMPSRGLVCEYTAAATAQPPVEPRLARSIAIGVAGATRLASVINRISTQPPQGEFACPNGQFGAVAVLAFDYADRTVDLWYKWSGCQTLDNGYVVAFQGANPSFYSGFQSVFDDLAPLPSR